MRSTTKLMYYMFQYDPVFFWFVVVENNRFLIPESGFLSNPKDCVLPVFAENHLQKFEITQLWQVHCWPLAYTNNYISIGYCVNKQNIYGECSFDAIWNGIIDPQI